MGYVPRRLALTRSVIDFAPRRVEKRCVQPGCDRRFVTVDPQEDRCERCARLPQSPRSRAQQISDALRAVASWPADAASVSHVARQINPQPPKRSTAPIDGDEWANACMLYWLMPAHRKREFWTLRGGRADKLAFLLRWGKFEQPKGAM